MYDDKTKSSLLTIAADLKRTADRLIELCKEDEKDETTTVEINEFKSE